MAKIVDGKLIANEILSKVLVDIKKLKKLNKTIRLAVIVVGFNHASEIYIKNKIKTCEKLKIELKKISLNDTISQNEINQEINKLNNDKTINGIIVQLPLPQQLNEIQICNLINPYKDVDGFCSINAGKLFLNLPGIRPCTPAGIMKMLEYEKIDVAGKNCVIIGKSNIVGKPLALMLLNKRATVTICNSKTNNLKHFVKNADILFSAVGKINLITGKMIKPGAVIVDVGINRLKNGKICGDVNFDEVKQHASIITPVPGGVGPLTVAMLMYNVVKATKLQMNI